MTSQKKSTAAENVLLENALQKDFPKGSASFQKQLEKEIREEYRSLHTSPVRGSEWREFFSIQNWRILLRWGIPSLAAVSLILLSFSSTRTVFSPTVDEPTSITLSGVVSDSDVQWKQELALFLEQEEGMDEELLQQLNEFDIVMNEFETTMQFFDPDESIVL